MVDVVLMGGAMGMGNTVRARACKKYVIVPERTCMRMFGMFVFMFTC